MTLRKVQSFENPTVKEMRNMLPILAARYRRILSAQIKAIVIP